MSILFNNQTLLQVGGQAPDFTLLNQHNQPVQLIEVLTRAWVILFFYPKDDSPICTAEACAFRYQFENFRAKGAEIMGISADSVASHLRFAEKQRLPFHLLSDPGRSVAREYGVPEALGLIPSRVTFVVDPQRIIRMVYPAPFTAKQHVEKALDFLRAEAT
jgi:thioredoxin-dependent peroxiredoxin